MFLITIKNSTGKFKYMSHVVAATVHNKENVVTSSQELSTRFVVVQTSHGKGHGTIQTIRISASL